ncbi:DUF4372 domain-containing protein [Lentibacillus salinarum]|uniref:DUF4372 domain-containing protein n=1 Tax=Lentibacillus salinarum TaxID=446820 RepID=A0ABW3ZUF1_9BACI
MDKYTTKSTINKLFEVLDEQKFLNVINVSNIDHYIKKLAAYKFLELLIIAQLNEAESLRDLSKQLKDNQGVQQAIEMDTISTSQLSRKQCDLPPFEKVFRHLVFEVQAQMKNKSIVRDIGKLLVIDSSTVSMSLSQYPLGDVSKNKIRRAAAHARSHHKRYNHA